MKTKMMIVGCPGSGKSYFARELSSITGIPIYYMDRLFWRENWTHVTRQELQEELREIYKKDKWIIDGNYSSTMEERIKQADIIYFLDIDEDICLESEKHRRGKKREDLPEYLEEKEDPEFIEFIKSYKNDGRPFTIDLLEKYKDKEIHIFKTREEKNEYLKQLL